MVTRREIYERLRSVALERYGDDNEARSIAECIVLSLGGISRSDLILEPNKELDIADLERIIDEIRAWRPVQYIVGSAPFDDMELEVREGVLVPRPETEELVRWVAGDMPPRATILDVGTGSGCIAIALARRLAGSSVWGMDISPEALSVARSNAERYASDVAFVEGDALGDFSQHFDTKFDAIVSNPPYIPVSDRTLMRPNVTEHEPSTALFVPDEDPLLFYRAIARTARGMLREGGRLYFEIYEMLSAQMCQMLATEGYDNVELRHDFKDKPRMICARVSSIER